MKFDDELIKKIMSERYEEEFSVNKAVSQFDEARVDGIREITTQAKWKIEIEKMIAKYAIKDAKEVQSAFDTCMELFDDIKAGKPDKLEINLIQRVQKFCGIEQELGATVLKIVEAQEETVAYIYFDNEINVEALLVIDSTNGKAFLAIKSEMGVLSFIELSEMHLLSMSPNSKPGKEAGLMSSYTRMTGKIYSSIIIGQNLLPVKNLLLVDVFPKKDRTNEGNRREYR